MTSATATQGSAVDGRRLRGERARRALIEATLAIIERDGFAGVTHRAVTREAGLPATSAAYHFASINDLLEASLLYADGLAAEALARCAADPTRSGRSPMVGCRLLRARVRLIAEYELYPVRRADAERCDRRQPVAHRSERAGAQWTSNVQMQRAICAYIDGLCIQSLVSGEQPEADELATTIRALL